MIKQHTPENKIVKELEILCNYENPWKSMDRINLGMTVKPLFAYHFCRLWNKNGTIGTKTQQKPVKNLSHHTDHLY
jgi:hypothetical protein